MENKGYPHPQVHAQPGYQIPQVQYTQPGYTQPQAQHTQPQYAIPQGQHTQPGFYPPSYDQTVTPVTFSNQPIVVPQVINVGPDPCQIVCPSCRVTILTNVEHEPSTKTHLLALLLCCCLCWPCACLPYCMDSCQNSNHYCPNCNAFIGSYDK